jgi:hypothetical protein
MIPADRDEQIEFLISRLACDEQRTIKQARLEAAIPATTPGSWQRDGKDTLALARRRIASLRDELAHKTDEELYALCKCELQKELAPAAARAAIARAEWGIWQHMDRVELWQAVALSLDLEPNFDASTVGRFHDRNPRIRFPRKFWDRLRIALSHKDHFRAVPGTPRFASWDERSNVRLSDFAAWAQKLGLELPHELTAREAAGSQPDAHDVVIQTAVIEPHQDAGATLGRRDRQLAVIQATIQDLKYEPLAIPLGGKAKIKKSCLKKHSPLFTDSGFDHAWNVALGTGSVRLTNHSAYSKK